MREELFRGWIPATAAGPRQLLCCGNRPAASFNLSAVAETPNSPIQSCALSVRAGAFAHLQNTLGRNMSITTNQDRALSGNTSQRVDQVLPNVYGDKSVSNYFNFFLQRSRSRTGHAGKYR